MSEKKKQETRFSLDSPIMTVTHEAKSISSQSRPQEEMTEEIVEKPPRPPPPKLLPFVPPDVLMSALFSAIQRKAWVRARRVCYELITWDPTRKNYRDLFYLIDNVIKISDQRVRTKRIGNRIPAVVASRAASPSSNSSGSEDEL